MLGVRCPICELKMDGPSVADWPFFPFCSKRCKTIDLGRWLKQSYGITADEPDDPDEFPETDTP